MKKKKWKIRNLAVSQEIAVHFKPFIFSFGIKSMLPIFSLNSFFFFFLSCDLQNLSSLTRDWTWVPTVGAWTVREVPMLSICKPQISQKSIEEGLMQSHGGQDENSGHEITLENFEKLSTLETLWREKLNFRHFSYNY